MAQVAGKYQLGFGGPMGRRPEIEDKTATVPTPPVHALTRRVQRFSTRRVQQYSSRRRTGP